MTEANDPPSSRTPGISCYDAFISYSHQADHELAQALANQLRRFATPWRPLRWSNAVRSLRIFRDDSVLAANPDLWNSIEAALSTSDWFVLLASPEAAQSPWVNKEIEVWLASKSTDRIILVVTNGDIEWNSIVGDFDWERSDALPPNLKGTFTREPRWIDLRWVREQRRVSTSDSRFQTAIADIASPLRGIPKDELIGEDVRQHRSLQRWRNGAVAGLIVLLIIALAAGEIAREQRDAAILHETEAIAERREAEHQSGIALARQLAAQAELVRSESGDRLNLSILLATESLRRHVSFEGSQSLGTALSLYPKQVARFQHAISSGPQNRVRELTFSADGRFLATASDNGTAILWNLSKPGGEPLVLHHQQAGENYQEHEGGGFSWSQPGVDAEVRTISLSPDGQYIATGNSDGWVRLWGLSSGKLVTRFNHDEMVIDLAFDPNNLYLASSSKDGTARLWSIKSGREIGRMTLGSENYDFREVREIAFSPDGQYAAAISTGGRVCIWNIEIDALDKCFSTGAVGLGIAYSPDGLSLATASENKVLVWDASSGERRWAMAHVDYLGNAKMDHWTWVMDIAFSPNGRYLASASRDGTARIWDSKSGQEVVRLAHEGDLSGIAFSPDSRLIAVASLVGNIRVWEVPSGRQILLARFENSHSIDSVVFNPDGQLFAAANWGGEIGIWRTDIGNAVASLPHPDDVTHIVFSPDGKRAATAGDDHMIRIWTTSDWQQVAEIKRFSPRQLRFSEDGAYLSVQSTGKGLELMAIEPPSLRAIPILSNRNGNDVHLRGGFLFARMEKTISVWSTDGGRLVNDNIGSTESVKRLSKFSVSGDGGTIATRYGAEAPIQVLQIPSGEKIGEIQPGGTIEETQLSPDGSRLAILLSQNSDSVSSDRHRLNWLEIWDVARARQLAQFPPSREKPAKFFFHPDGQRLLVMDGWWTAPDKISFLDPANPKSRVTLVDVPELSRFAYSPNGEYLGAVGAGRVKVWEVATGQLVGGIPTATRITDLAFMPGNHLLATAGRDNRVTLWYWRPEDLIEQACSRLKRNLSKSEWRDFLGARPYRKTCPGIADENKSEATVTKSIPLP